VVESPQPVVPSSVWLENAYSLLTRLGHPLYSSSKSGLVFLQTLADRETGICGKLESVPFPNQLLDNMVHSTPEVVDGISSQQADLRSYRRALIQEIGRGYVFGVKLGNDLVWTEIKEGSTLLIEITDVLFGPFNFLASSG
jgi:hypothetical protein